MSGLVIGAISIGMIFLLVYLGVYVAIALASG